MGRTQHAPRSSRSQYFPHRFGMDLPLEQITRESSKTERDSKDMHAGRSELTRRIESRSQGSNGNGGNNVRRTPDVRIRGKRTSQNPSRDRSPHQNNPGRTGTSGRGAQGLGNHILGLSQPKTKAPTVDFPTSRKQREDSDLSLIHI